MYQVLYYILYSTSVGLHIHQNNNSDYKVQTSTCTQPHPQASKAARQNKA